MKPDINVTPLIDVLLVLLIIFMVVSPSRPTAFKTKVPAENREKSNLKDNPNKLTVNVGADRSLTLNFAPVDGSASDGEALTARLRDVFALREKDGVVRPDSNEIEKTVYVRAPKGIPYGEVANVVDAVKLAGASPIALEIDSLQ